MAIPPASKVFSSEHRGLTTGYRAAPFAPDACDDFSAQMEAGGTVLTLRVVVRGSRLHPGGCGAPGRYARFQWRARIEPLEPGPLRVRVLYDYRGLCSHFRGDTAVRRDPYPDRVVAEQTVTVN